VNFQFDHSKLGLRSVVWMVGQTRICHYTSCFWPTGGQYR